MFNVRSEVSYIIADSTDTRRTVERYCEKLPTNKYGTLDEMNRFLE